MSKYHKGDKFIVEIKEVMNSDNGTLYRSDFKTLTFDDNGLDKLKKYEELSSDTKEMLEMKAYNKGLEDAWELAKKIVLNPNNGGMSLDELQIVFGKSSSHNVLRSFTSQEALAKLEAYEKEQAEIKVGDVVEHNGDTVFIVTKIDKMICGYDKEGNMHSFCFPNQYIKKTGKHIELADLFKQIGGSGDE